LVQPVRTVVEEQQVSIRENVRRVLAGKRGRTELPVDGTGLAVDHHDGRDVPEADQDVSIGHFRYTVGNGPHIAITLDLRDGVVHRIEMVPASPLPDDLALCRHLDKIGGIHLTIVILRSGPAASDLGNDLIRNFKVTGQT
jgi:hypothetical protein